MNGYAFTIMSMPVDEKKEYLEIRIPKLGKSSTATILLILLLMFMSFALGSLYTKVRYLEQGGTLSAGNITGTVNAKNASDAFSQYAKQLGLDTKKFDACLKDGKYTTKVNSDATEASNLSVNATPGFFINGKFLGGAYPYESFKEIIDKELDGTASQDYKDYSETLQQAYEDPNQKSFDPAPKTIEIGSSPIRGDKNAKVTIVEYSDFQCPFCQRAFTTMEQVLKDYNGKVRLVYKHLPIQSIHPNAQKASEATECAGEQNKFWEYHDTLFNKQQEWSTLPQAS